MPQINLYQTESVSDADDHALQHNCLRVPVPPKPGRPSREVISYCMSELPPKLNAEKKILSSKFTFADLSKKNVSSEQLYRWWASIDIVEDYQFYFNQLAISNDPSMGTRMFYNCTLPKFGPLCQYEFDYYQLYYSSLQEMIVDYYRQRTSDSIDLTCYIHLQCHRGHSPACLDWTEICDGVVDCLDGGLDEKHCWQLEINEDEEYQTDRKQYVSQSLDQRAHPGGKSSFGAIRMATNGRECPNSFSPLDDCAIHSTLFEIVSFRLST